MSTHNDTFIIIRRFHIMTRTGKPRPLLLTHGWPGSVWEFYKILPMLTDPAAYGGNDDDAFEVICPSIPGYGFSEAAHQKGQMFVNAKFYTKLFRYMLVDFSLYF